MPRILSEEQAKASQAKHGLKPGGMQDAVRLNALDEARWAKAHNLPIDPEWMKKHGISLGDL